MFLFFIFIVEIERLLQNSHYWVIIYSWFQIFKKLIQNLLPTHLLNLDQLKIIEKPESMWNPKGIKVQKFLKFYPSMFWYFVHIFWFWTDFFFFFWSESTKIGSPSVMKEGTRFGGGPSCILSETKQGIRSQNSMI